MYNRNSVSIRLFAMLFVFSLASRVEAQLSWRVSVKVVLDENDLRAVDGVTFSGCCDLNTDVEIEAKVDAGTDILRGMAAVDVPRTEERGYTLDLVEIIELDNLPPPPTNVRACSNRPGKFCEISADCPTCVGGISHGAYCDDSSDCSGGTCTGTSTCAQVSHWFDAPIIREVRNEIRNAANVDAASKALWGWNDDAINIYILGSDGSGTAYDMVLLGQDLASPNTPFHEMGHFLNLDHTHGGGGGSPDCFTYVSDYVNDTMWDIAGPGCTWDQNDIANHTYTTECGGSPCSYWELSADDQRRVDQTFFNVMCYRHRREVLTPGQLDRMTDHSNTTVNHVASGLTHFVDADGPPGTPDGSSTLPYHTVTEGTVAANARDIVLIRRGHYNETLLVKKRMMLRSSRGNAVIGTNP